jgi:hypothetical protein
MDRTKKILACVAAAHMLLSMMAMVIASRKIKRNEIRVGISYGPIVERDRMRMEYLDAKIWNNDITCINMLQLGRDSFFWFCKVFRDCGLLEDTIHMCIEEKISLHLNTVGHNLRNRWLLLILIAQVKLLAIGALGKELIRPPSLDTPSKIAGTPRWDPYFKVGG